MGLHLLLPAGRRAPVHRETRQYVEARSGAQADRRAVSERVLPAHLAVDERIGEGVTNSYAVLYLGADAANMSTQNEYAMTPETDALARAVHDGDLACYDNVVLLAR